MKLRHAALALVGWYLTVQFGQTYPKDCPDCSLGFGQGGGWGWPPFKTKTDCQKAGNVEVRAFFADAKQKGEQVAWPPSFRCVERKT